MKLQQHKNNGSVLIFTLFVLVFLTSIALSLGFSMRQQIQLTQRNMERIKSYQIAKGVFSQLVIEFERDKEDNTYDAYNEDWIEPLRKDDEPRELKFENQKREPIGTYSVSVVDENGKVDINIISVEGLTRILDNFSGINSNRLAREILTYRDNQTAIKKFYSVYELLKIPTMERRIFFGEDTNENGILDPWEDDGNKNLPLDNNNGKLDLGLKDYLTVYSSGGININTAPQEVLAALPGMDEELAEAFVEMRDDQPFESIEELKELTEIPEPVRGLIAGWFRVRSDQIKLAITARTNQAQTDRIIMAVVDRTEKSTMIRYWREN